MTLDEIKEEIKLSYKHDPEVYTDRDIHLAWCLYDLVAEGKL